MRLKKEDREGGREEGQKEEREGERKEGTKEKGKRPTSLASPKPL